MHKNIWHLSIKRSTQIRSKSRKILSSYIISKVIHQEKWYESTEKKNYLKELLKRKSQYLPYSSHLYLVSKLPATLPVSLLELPLVVIDTPLEVLVLHSNLKNP